MDPYPDLNKLQEGMIWRYIKLAVNCTDEVREMTPLQQCAKICYYLLCSFRKDSMTSTHHFQQESAPCASQGFRSLPKDVPVRRSRRSVLLDWKVLPHKEYLQT